MKSATHTGERAWLVAFCPGRKNHAFAEEHLEELALLAESAGAQVVGQSLQARPKADPSTLVGKGMVEEITQTIKRDNLQVVIFDNELSPSQNRNLEKQLECKVLDRTSLILDIFASRARTREGKLQVELAQMQYLYPRLVGRWMHFSRQEGGIGMRGPGEKQLEVDRRIVKERIQALTQKLEKVMMERKIRRERRQENRHPVVSLVGYTNAGKSSLLNALVASSCHIHKGAEALKVEYTDDRHFATLDPVTRRVALDHHLTVLVSDTVGFVQKLPHQLIASFRATFEEIATSDLLLHVIDMHHPQSDVQSAEVLSVIKELNADHIPILTVYNKIDLLGAAFTPPEGSDGLSNVYISATQSLGLAELRHAMIEKLEALFPCFHLSLPAWEGKLRAILYDEASVLEEKNCEDRIEMKVRLPQKLIPQYRPFFLER